MNLVDPEGMKIVIGTRKGRVAGLLGFNTFEHKVRSDLTLLKELGGEIRKAIVEIENSQEIIRIISAFDRKNKKGENGYSRNKNILYYNPDNDFPYANLLDDYYRPPFVALAHELGHAQNDIEGKSIEYDRSKITEGDKDEILKLNENEQNSIRLEN